MTATIFMNGKPSQPFQARKGLSQQDPLSLFLFALAMEYLSKSFDSLELSKDFLYHPRCRRIKLTHILFDDDLLLFCKGDMKLIGAMMEQFTIFSKSSGLEENMEKCEIDFAKVDGRFEHRVCKTLTIRMGVLPFKYLGVPFAARKLRYIECRTVVDQITKLVSHWSSKIYLMELDYARSTQY